MPVVKQTINYQDGAQFQHKFKRQRYRTNNLGDLVTSDEKVETSDTSFSKYTVSSKTSTSTPGFFKMNKAELPHNEYELFRLDEGQLSGYLIDSSWVSSSQSYETNQWAGQGPVGLWGVGYVAGHLAPDLSSLSSLEARANALLLQKVKNQKVNVAVALAEGKKTVDMIADKLVRLVSLIRALKHGDIWAAGRAIGGRPSRRVRRQYRAQRPQNAAATAWLEMQYGWKPLMMDIRGAISMFGEGDTSKQYIKCQVRVSDVQSDSTSYEGTRQFICESDRTVSLAVKMSVTYVVEMGYSTLSARLGLQNPALLAWELVPFSFVADWALPIGDWLGNLDATAGCRLVGGSKTYVREARNKNRVRANPLFSGSMESGPHYRHQEGLASSETSAISISRQKLGEFPEPQLPSLKDPLSVGHAANALALIQSAFRGRR